MSIIPLSHLLIWWVVGVVQVPLTGPATTCNTGSNYSFQSIRGGEIIARDLQKVTGVPAIIIKCTHVTPAPPLEFLTDLVKICVDEWCFHVYAFVEGVKWVMKNRSQTSLSIPVGGSINRAGIMCVC
jgi:hypothetical protein